MTTEVNLRVWRLTPLLLFVVILCPFACGKVIYVDDDAAGANDGTNWENAYTFLQDALIDANSAEKPVEIRVAQGTYTPDKGAGQIPGDREATFQLINGVALAGGYAGIGTVDPNLRDFELYETILSGDLRSNDIFIPLDSFFACFTGPLWDLENGCETFDFDGDNHVDDSDMTALLNEYNYDENSYNVVTGSSTDPNAIIDGFIITSGNAEPYLPVEPIQHQPRGGGMYNFLGNPEVLNCKFRENFAGDGGGIYNAGGNPRFYNCTFYKNVARELTIQSYDINAIFYGLGGAIYDSGSRSMLVDCRFIGNIAYSGGGMCNGASSPMLTSCIFEKNRAESSGGGIFNKNESEPTLNNCIFLSNNAHSGAGVQNGHSSPILTECIFNGNIAERFGGGVANYDSKPVLTGCKFIGNQSSVFGGGIYNWQSNPMIQNCVFAGNSTRDGGGIYAYLDSNPTLVNCTFADNLGEKGRALNSDSGHKINNIKLINCILWDSGNEISNDDGSVITITYSNIQGGWEGEGNIYIDPCFADPGYWADADDPNIAVEPEDPNAVWVDGDYHLKSQAGRWDPVSESWVVDDVTSSCIDAGDPNMPVGDEPEPNGGRINMGAYGGTPEASKTYILATIIYVDDDAIGNNDGSSWENAYTFLQDALYDAETSEKPVEIRVAQGVYKPKLETGYLIPGTRVTGSYLSKFQLINGVALLGGYAGLTELNPDTRDFEKYETILSGDLNGDDIDVINPSDLFDEPTRLDNCSSIVIGSGTNRTAVLDGFIITGGRVRRHPAVIDAPTGRAGGMMNEYGSPTINNCTFIGNSAESCGGGMLINAGSDPILTNCTFINNYAKRGGGVESGNSSPTFINCTFTNNYADDGAGMSVYYSETTQSTPIELTNCTFEDNGVKNFGGGLKVYSGDLVLRNCVFIGNSASKGGGMYNDSGNPMLTYCRFISNSASISGGGLSNQEDCNLTITNCLIVGNWSEDYGGGIFSNGEITLLNCTIFGNRARSYYGGGIYLGVGRISNSIFYGNMAGRMGNEISQGPHGAAGCRPEFIKITHSLVGNGPNAFDIPQCYSGEWLYADPLFVNPGYWDPNGTPDDTIDDFWIDGDYHLKSQAGRWDPASESWLVDDVTSPCIDTGDPNMPVGDEPEPNGGIINMGAYGGTEQASLSLSTVHAVGKIPP